MINCAAYNLVDKPRMNLKRRFESTLLERGIWRSGARRRRCHCCTVSTDYVFGLEKSDRPWREVIDGPGQCLRGVKAGGRDFRAQPVPSAFWSSNLWAVWSPSRSRKGNFVETMLRLGRGAA